MLVGTSLAPLTSQLWARQVNPDLFLQDIDCFQSRKADENWCSVFCSSNETVGTLLEQVVLGAWRWRCWRDVSIFLLSK